MSRKLGWFVGGGLLVALVLAGVVSNFASSSPDGLEYASREGCETVDENGEETLVGTCMAQREEELRRHTPDRAWRRNGWVVVERRLLEVVQSHRVDDNKALIGLLPHDLGNEFTTADLAAGLGRSRRSAQQMAYCLARAGAIVPTGKIGNAITYRIEESEA